MTLLHGPPGPSAISAASPPTSPDGASASDGQTDADLIVLHVGATDHARIYRIGADKPDPTTRRSPWPILDDESATSSTPA